MRVASDEAERALFWKARKSAFGAVARVAPNYYLHDCVVPRTRLVEVLERIEEIAAERDLIVMNVFHAGDGNLHPLIAFDRRDAEQVERVHAAGKDIIEACVAVGGVLSGEHGIGLEKRDFMPLTFDAVSLDAQARARDAFDPDGPPQPGQGPAARQPLRRARARRRVAAARHLAVTEVLSPASPQEAAVGAGRGDRRARVGGRGGRRHALAPGAPGPGARPRAAHRRRCGAVVAHEPADLTVTVEAGLPAAELAGAGGRRPARAGPRPTSAPARRSAACWPRRPAAASGCAWAPCATRCWRWCSPPATGAW